MALVFFFLLILPLYCSNETMKFYNPTTTATIEEEKKQKQSTFNRTYSNFSTQSISQLWFIVFKHTIPSSIFISNMSISFFLRSFGVSFVPLHYWIGYYYYFSFCEFITVMWLVINSNIWRKKNNNNSSRSFFLCILDIISLFDRISVHFFFSLSHSSYYYCYYRFYYRPVIFWSYELMWTFKNGFITSTRSMPNTNKSMSHIYMLNSSTCKVFSQTLTVDTIKNKMLHCIWECTYNNTTFDT